MNDKSSLAETFGGRRAAARQPERAVSVAEPPRPPAPAPSAPKSSGPPPMTVPPTPARPVVYRGGPSPDGWTSQADYEFFLKNGRWPDPTPPTPPAESAPELDDGTTKMVEVTDGFPVQASDMRVYRKGDVVALPIAEADALIRADRARAVPSRVWLATLSESGVLIGGVVINRDKPQLVPYRVAMGVLNPVRDAHGRAHADAEKAKVNFRIISPEAARSWDPTLLRWPDARDPVGRTRDPRDRLPNVRVRATAPGLLGRYAVKSDEVVLMDEWSAVVASVMKHAPTGPFAGQTKGVILDRLSADGEKFRKSLEAFAAKNEGSSAEAPGGWSTVSAGFPTYPGLKERIVA